MEPKKEFNLVRLWPVWFGISAIVIIGGMVSIATQGINWGIDFKGGALFEYRLPKPVSSSAESMKVQQRARRVLKQQNVEHPQVQVADQDFLVIRTDASDSSEANDQQSLITKGMQEEFKGIEWVGTEMVGPVIGRELKRKAILGTLLGCLCILLYVTIRYEFRFAVAGIVALVHDVAVVTGVLSILQVEINSAFVAALLTVVGYSINDSVVIFDRIRENMKLRRRDPFDEVVNSSLWQTMPRSINTSVTTEFVLLALFLFGGATIHHFALALLIGITSGAYSSIFTASPVLVLWRSASDRRRRVKVPSRQGRPQRTSGAKAKPKPATEATQAEAVSAAVDRGQSGIDEEVGGQTSTATQADQRSTQKKRRPKRSGKRKRRH